jgi:AhpD family alkylhydroperoxidase
VIDHDGNLENRRRDNDVRLERIQATAFGSDRRNRKDQSFNYAKIAEITGAGAKTAKLDDKSRELIALAVAVTRQCDGCITVHVDAAVKFGATREEVAEALGVAIAMNAGAALVYSARVMDAYDVISKA